MGGPKKEIYKYTSPWNIYSLAWSERQDQEYRLAIGSFIERHANKIQIVQLKQEKFQLLTSIEHPYPATKILFMPDQSVRRNDLLATSGDFLRLFLLKEQNDKWEYELKGELKVKTKQVEFCAPLTSFDWCRDDLTQIGTSSIDTTVTIWDIEKQKTKSQLIAHDKEVYDICFSDKHTFASVGADGSVRMFDLRSLKHSNIMYETQDFAPLLRLDWNRKNPNYFATFEMDSSNVVVLDVRVPSLPVAVLDGHSQAVNSVHWAPHSASHISSAGDDANILIWDISPIPKPIESPILSYHAESPVNQIHWGPLHPDWIAAVDDSKLSLLKV